MFTQGVGAEMQIGETAPITTRAAAGSTKEGLSVFEQGRVEKARLLERS